METCELDLATRTLRDSVRACPSPLNAEDVAGLLMYMEFNTRHLWSSESSHGEAVPIAVVARCTDEHADALDRAGWRPRTGTDFVLAQYEDWVRRIARPGLRKLEALKRTRVRIASVASRQSWKDLAGSRSGVVAMLIDEFGFRLRKVALARHARELGRVASAGKLEKTASNVLDRTASGWRKQAAEARYRQPVLIRRDGVLRVRFAR
jgi:hypothetical protein